MRWVIEGVQGTFGVEVGSAVLFVAAVIALGIMAECCIRACTTVRQWSENKEGRP